MGQVKQGVKVDYTKLTPLWAEVVVQIDKVPEKLGSIIIPDNTRDIDRHAVVVGTLIAQGPMAFIFNINGTPQKQDVDVGTKVIFKPYSGDLAEAAPGAQEAAEYRIMDSKHILGVLREGDA